MTESPVVALLNPTQRIGDEGCETRTLAAILFQWHREKGSFDHECEYEFERDQNGGRSGLDNASEDVVASDSSYCSGVLSLPQSLDCPNGR